MGQFVPLRVGTKRVWRARAPVFGVPGGIGAHGGGWSVGGGRTRRGVGVGHAFTLRSRLSRPVVPTPVVGLYKLNSIDPVLEST
jgi:hypothetical protein